MCFIFVVFTCVSVSAFCANKCVQYFVKNCNEKKQVQSDISLLQHSSRTCIEFNRKCVGPTSEPSTRRVSPSWLGEIDAPVNNWSSGL